MTGSRLDAVREADVVVLGAGAAGLSVALALGGRRVDLLAKGRLGKTGNSPWAQGGVAGAVGPTDSPALHAADTLAVAGDLADPGDVEHRPRQRPPHRCGVEVGPTRQHQMRPAGKAGERVGEGAGTVVGHLRWPGR